MFSPTSPLTLDQNPQYATLQTHLTRTLLSPTGAIPPPPTEQKSRALTDKALQSAQHTAAKISVIRCALPLLLTSNDSSPLPEAVPIPTQIPALATILDLIAHLTSPPPSPFFPPPPHPPSLISTHLSLTLPPLLSSLSPVPQTTTSARLTALASAQERLHASRLTLASAAGALLEAQRALVEEVVRALEGVKYGSLGRGGRARGEYLGMVARGLEGKVRLLHLTTLQTLYPPPALASLTAYAQHLETTVSRLRDREDAARARLAEYEAQEGMEEVARVYAAVRKEGGVVGGMVGMLGG
ncbi:hypothetical protein MMC12_007027 [Toensbergia leucococca]|nr:hypothetical protein [Toensbergia leucococca]